MLFSLLFLGGCTVRYPVIDSLGENCKGTVWCLESFQDYTDYGKFICEGITAEELEENDYFSVVTEHDIPILQGYLEDFESWLTMVEDDQPPKIHYDFSANVMNSGDYFYLESEYSVEDERAYWNYDLYYLDIETQTLYYFHNNI